MSTGTQPRKSTDRVRPRIALICDCAAIKAELKSILGGWKYEIDCHPPGSFSGALLPGGTHLVVLDAGNSLARGLALLKELKAASPAIPVVIVTGDSSEDDAIAAFRLGARDFFKRPLDVLLFRERVDVLMKLRGTSLERRLPLPAGDFVPAGARGRANTDMPAGIVKSLLFMGDNLAQPLSLDTLAGQARMSKYHFCRSFKRHTGTTPRQSLACMRIERAKSLLRSGHVTISMVADEVGFGDGSALARHFKKATGMSATDFRKSIKSNR